MAEEYRAKIFKSGNSVALRLPKDLGLKEGTEVLLREEHGQYRFEPIDAPKRKISGEGWMGKMPWLKPLTPEEREFDASPRVWDDPDWPDWAERK